MSEIFGKIIGIRRGLWFGLAIYGLCINRIMNYYHLSWGEPYSDDSSVSSSVSY